MSNEDSLHLARLTAFSDGVIAIAITLLAFQVTPPDVSQTEIAQNFRGVLVQMAPAIAGFLQSFLVIGIYWMIHHRLFQYIKRFDHGLMWYNLFFLATISFLPVPSIFMIRFLTEPNVMLFYLVCMAITGVATLALWRYASHRHRLVDSRLTAEFIRWITIRSIIVPGVAVIAFVLYFVTRYAVYTFVYILMFVFAILPRLYPQPPMYTTEPNPSDTKTEES